MDCAMDCSPLSSLRLSLLLEDMQDLESVRKTLRSGEVDRDLLGSLGPLGSLGISGTWHHALAQARSQHARGRTPSALSLTVESTALGMLFTQQHGAAGVLVKFCTAVSHDE